MLQVSDQSGHSSGSVSTPGEPAPTVGIPCPTQQLEYIPVAPPYPSVPSQSWSEQMLFIPSQVSAEPGHSSRSVSIPGEPGPSIGMPCPAPHAEHVPVASFFPLPPTQTWSDQTPYRPSQEPYSYQYYQSELNNVQQYAYGTSGNIPDVNHCQAVYPNHP